MESIRVAQKGNVGSWHFRDLRPLAICERPVKVLWRLNDRAEPWKYRCLAANQNYPDAQGLVADHYRQGRDPVTRDLLRAYVWYRLAELNGYEGDFEVCVR
jgi:TPR repeat protein